MVSRKVLSLTKPKGNIYKTKSLGHYITDYLSFRIAPLAFNSIVSMIFPLVEAPLEQPFWYDMKVRRQISFQYRPHSQILLMAWVFKFRTQLWPYRLQKNNLIPKVGILVRHRLIGWGERLHWLHLCREVNPPLRQLTFWIELNHLIMRLKWNWSFGKFEVTFRCHRSLVHAYPDW